MRSRNPGFPMRSPLVRFVIPVLRNGPVGEPGLRRKRRRPGRQHHPARRRHLPARRRRCAGVRPDLHRRPRRSLELRRRCARATGKTGRRPCGALRGSRSRQNPPQTASRPLHRRRRNRQPEPAVDPVGLCDELAGVRQKPFRSGSGRRQRRPQGDLERLFRRATGIPARQKGRRPARRRLPGRQGSRNPQRVISRRSRDAAPLQHQGQVRVARPRHRQCRHLSSAGMPQLSGADKAGSLVLFRGRRPGRGFRRAYNCRAGK